MVKRNSQTKQYDIFISYSHSDRPLVQNLAEQLHHRGVRVWWDEWEIKPGDTLRERIIQGIDNAKNFLVVISETTLSSQWVKYELNSALISEIEDQDVRVVPIITGTIQFTDLPTDLRAKYGLVCKDTNTINRTVEEMIRLIKPHEEQRKQLIRELNEPDLADPARTTSKLRMYALTGHDQAVQRAALSGLKNIGTPEAIAVIAERSIMLWGTGTIQIAINKLVAHHQNGGLFCISASLITDSRFYHEKLKAIEKCLLRVKEHELAERTNELRRNAGSIYDFPQTMPLALQEISQYHQGDVQLGVSLAKMTASHFKWCGEVTPPSQTEVDSAMKYAALRVPGFTSALLKRTEGWL
jgi:hypothetical protein